MTAALRPAAWLLAASVVAGPATAAADPAASAPPAAERSAESARRALVDANRATQAQLEALRGVGPGLAEAILEERRKAPFKDWADLVARVKGVGTASAARLQAAGLTVLAPAAPPSAPAR